MTWSNFVRHNPTGRVIRCASPKVAQNIALQLNVSFSKKCQRDVALWVRVACPHWYK